MKSIRWICIQKKTKYSKQDWFGEWTMAYTRKESIRLLIGEGTMTWQELKSDYGWRVSKIEITITELNPN